MIESESNKMDLRCWFISNQGKEWDNILFFHLYCKSPVKSLFDSVKLIRMTSYIQFDNLNKHEINKYTSFTNT